MRKNDFVAWAALVHDLHITHDWSWDDVLKLVGYAIHNKYEMKDIMSLAFTPAEWEGELKEKMDDQGIIRANCARDAILTELNMTAHQRRVRIAVLLRQEEVAFSQIVNALIN